DRPAVAIAATNESRSQTTARRLHHPLPNRPAESWPLRHCEHCARSTATPMGGAMDWTCAVGTRAWRLVTSIGLLGVLVALPVPVTACAPARCTPRPPGVPANPTACTDACWQAFMSCLNGCTTEFCAPFCQVDYGRCVAGCPVEAPCFDACDAASGCVQCSTDDDGDGVGDATDNCPGVPNPTQSDLD